jgi:hypothetical protein
VNVVTFGDKRYTFSMRSDDTIATVKRRIQANEKLASPIFERLKVCWEDPYQEKQSLKDDMTIANYIGVATTFNLTTEMVRTNQIVSMQSARSQPSRFPSLPAPPSPSPPPPCPQHSLPAPSTAQPVPPSRTQPTVTNAAGPAFTSSSSSSSSSSSASQRQMPTVATSDQYSEPEIRAVDTALAGNSMFITGPAGTAKV